MLHRLVISDFKSFRHTVVPFGAFTLLAGANASGKSNVREALMLLHGVARGYSLAEALGEKWGRGGELEWGGIRGGAAQALRRGAAHFTIAAELTVTVEGRPVDAAYAVGVELRSDGTPVLERERLSLGNGQGYDTHPDDKARGSNDRTIIARMRKGNRGTPPDETFVRDRPILRQLDEMKLPPVMRRNLDAVQEYLASMRFLDLDPDAARRSSPRGVTSLGDRGQNLSSVLAALAADPLLMEGITGWIRALTPMDAVDVVFESDLNNRTLAVLVEEDGGRTPLSSASDGTVRFLAIIALLFSSDPPSLIFLEEIENGIHPHRIDLLLELLEQRLAEGSAQVVATSHSPQLMQSAWQANEDTLPVLVTKLAAQGSIAVNLRQEHAIADVIGHGDGKVGTTAELMTDGWFEDVIHLIAEDVAS